MFDRGRHYRAKIGFILLATEQTIQDDVMELRPDGVGMHFARAPIADSITVSTLMAQAGDLAHAASTLLPDGSLDVICYACTSASLVIGETRVNQELRAGSPGARPTSIITGVIRALRALGVTRLAVTTPYLDEINDLEADYLTRAGFEIAAIQGLNLEKDSDMVKVRPAFIADYAAQLDSGDIEAIFISCGALRSMEIVDDLEQRLGKPVICSNQAMIWDCLRLAGIEDRVEGYGTLFRNF